MKSRQFELEMKNERLWQQEPGLQESGLLDRTNKKIKDANTVKQFNRVFL